MKKLLIAFGLLLACKVVHAGQDRFGSTRQEVPRSSFTASEDPGVVIASHPTGGSLGPFILRTVYCSGVVASTITFYDTQKFTANPSTRDVFAYNPVTPLAILGTSPSQVDFSSYYSSGISYIKIGLAPCGIRWDYLVDPDPKKVPYRP